MIAALFPGQNSHAVGMAKDFYDHSPAARRVLDEAEAALPGVLALMWQGPLEELTLTAHQQPALVAAAAAAFAAYQEAGGALPRYGAGHSLGEYSAYVAAGALSVADAIRLVNKRGQYMQAAVPAGVGAMAAILKVTREVIAQVCAETAGVVELANLNTPEQTVISGEAAAVGLASTRLQSLGARVVPLNVSAPFHCTLMQPAADKLARDLAAVEFKEPSFQIVCNVTADVLPDVKSSAQLLTEQVTMPVRWVETVEKLDALGVTHYLEFGSGKVLTGLVGRILDKPKALAVTDMASLERALTALS
jgi:[acyl-carrier-protein] S-malonyltransferase